MRQECDRLVDPFRVGPCDKKKWASTNREAEVIFHQPRRLWMVPCNMASGSLNATQVTSGLWWRTGRYAGEQGGGSIPEKKNKFLEKEWGELFLLLLATTTTMQGQKSPRLSVALTLRYIATMPSCWSWRECVGSSGDHAKSSPVADGHRLLRWNIRPAPCTLAPT
jgi:hypothetical protein